MIRQEIGKGTFITVIPGEKFKRNLLVFHMVIPGNRQNANELALLPHVLERRCATIADPMLLSRKLFDLYGAELSAESYMAGSNRILTMAISGLKNGFALDSEDLEHEYIDLCCNMLFNPALENGIFANLDVEIERAKQTDYLKSELNEKRSYCLRQARRKLYGNTSLGIESAGYLNEMEHVTQNSLFTAYQELLKTAQLEVTCCGIEAEKVKNALQKRLDKIERAPVSPSPRSVVKTPDDFKEISEAMDTAQGKLCIILTSGQKADARRDAVMRLASALLGGLPTSRLFMNVREKQSLCYYCTSSYAPLCGTLTMDSGIAHEDAPRAAEAMLHEFTELQHTPVLPQELTAAKSALKNAFLAAKDSPDALASWVFNEHLRESDLSLDEETALIESVRADEVQEVLSSFTPALQYVLTCKEDV